MVVTVAHARAPRSIERRVTTGRRVEHQIRFAGLRARRTELSLPGVGDAVLAPAAEGAELTISLDDDRPVLVDESPEATTVRITLVGEERRARQVRDLRLTTVRRCTQAGVVRYHVLTIPSAAVRRVRVVTAGRFVGERRPLSAMAAGALAAINGGFFDPATGLPLGAVKIDGEWIRPPLYGRSALLLPRDGPPRIAGVEWCGEVRSAGRAERIGELNGRPGPATACLVTTPRWPAGEWFPGFATALSIAGMRVYLRSPVRPVAVVLASRPDVVGSVLGAGPRLVRAGRVEITAASERFRPDVTDSVVARAAVGLVADGSMRWVVAEGVRPISRGLSLPALAQLLVQLGCAEGLGLDGGPSATMVIEGRAITLAPGAAETPVATGLVVDPA